MNNLEEHSSQIINVYNLTQFELSNCLRNQSFRFIKYNGSNYDELRAYLSAGNSQWLTQIWQSNRLNKGCYYTFGSHGFQEVQFYDIRCCIASNPYLIRDGEKVKLSLNTEHIQDYLLSHPSSYAFCYEHIESLYYYNPKINSFCFRNSKHKRGIAKKELPLSNEWYLGCDDGLLKYNENFKTVYTLDIHSVRFDVDFLSMANRVVELIFLINKTKHDFGEEIIFLPSWEDYERHKILSTPITNRPSLQLFAAKLYNYLYEETKREIEDSAGHKSSLNRASLPEEYKNDKFIRYVNELRNYFAHGVSEYKTTSPITINTICEDYSIGQGLPQEGNLHAFNKLQEGLLRDFIHYLEGLYNLIKKRSKISGKIVFEDDFVVCANVQLHNRFKEFAGCYCQISANHRTENTNDSTKEKFPFYCKTPDFIILSNPILGIIEQDGSEVFCLDNNGVEKRKIRLTKEYEFSIGKRIKIEKICFMSSFWHACDSQIYFIEGNTYHGIIDNDKNHDGQKIIWVKYYPHPLRIKGAIPADIKVRDYVVFSALSIAPYWYATNVNKFSKNNI